ncbi:hypothetical protein FPOAC2_12528 [Fusarium poae]|uniref:SGNH hydrolase-type esterase domain-containing protein n=1 Tax=Fusarium poae TaxID=36050 RepID=A0A1B8AGH6_FUSPO|nr:hypothetical protein FPOAC1_012192 [Fusarium poae]KAG8667364.1 hypothetical protein FPOAC1_012192 [Fusarium poae]OBS19593.1 hypothetical protein FPOA_11318 [Fusarium poae]
MSEKLPTFTDDFLIRQFKTNPPGKYNIALLGTTLFGRFKYYTARDHYFKENPCLLNLGGSLGADRVRNVQRLIDEGFLRCLKQHQPNLTIIYLQMGDGDITKNGLSNSDAQTYGRIVTSLRDLFPEAQIVITSFFQQHGFSKHVIEEANKMLRHIASCSGDAVSFLAFTADQKEIVSNDQIHLTNDGFRKWYDFVQNDINNR